MALFISSLPDRPLLDRIVRGRTWIVLMGVLLAGIVAMQVEMLKLNASVGRSIALGTALQSRNEMLRASVSSLSDAQRIERLASGMGMVMPGPTSLDFLDASRVNAGKAAASIHAPDPGAFAAALQASAAGAVESGAPSAATSGGGTSVATAPQTTASQSTSTATPTTTATGLPQTSTSDQQSPTGG